METNQFISNQKEEIILFLKNTKVVNVDLIIMFSDKCFMSDLTIQKLLSEKFGNTPILGCSTAGGIVGCEMHDASFILNFIKFEHSVVRKASIAMHNEMDSFKAGQLLVEQLNHEELSHVFVLSDGINVDGVRLVNGINSRLPLNVGVSGGMAADSYKYSSTFVSGLGNVMGSDIVSAIGLYGKDIHVQCSSFGAWSSFGNEHIVTKNNGKMVMELDGKPALDVYKADLGIEAETVIFSKLWLPYCLIAEPKNNCVTREITGVDTQSGSILFADTILTGSKLKLIDTRVNAHINQAEINYQMSSFGSSYKVPENKGLVIMVSCIGQKQNLKQLTELEIQSVSTFFNQQYKFTGFYSHGEISFDTDYSAYLFNYTDVKKVRAYAQAPLPAYSLYNQTMTVTAISED